MKLICPLEEDQVNKMSSICDILINKNTEPFHSCIDELLRLRSEMNSIRTTKFQSKSCGNSKCGNGSAYTNSNKPRLVLNYIYFLVDYNNINQNYVLKKQFSTI